MSRFAPDAGPADWLRAALDLMVFCLLAFLALALVALLQPRVATVYREWLSGRCVAVADGLAGGDCDNLPPVHDTAWVGEHWGAR